MDESHAEPDLAALRRLIETMEILRGPDGCPWDREQTFRSLAPHVIEEAHELADAIRTGDPDAIREECGDLLLQVVFLARIATEEGAFGMAEVADGIADKLIRRHPHVFGAAPRAEGSEAALASWEEAKAREKAARPSQRSDLPASLPALLLAVKARKRVGKGREEPDTASIHDAVRVFEAAEDPEAVERAAGELLFRVAGEAKRAGADPETALRARALQEVAGIKTPDPGKR